MRSIGNLKGTIMRENDCLVDFGIVRGEITKLEILSDRLPVEFRLFSDEADALLSFLDERVVPETRIGLSEELQKIGIPYFSMENMLHYNNGFYVSDKYWVRFPEGRQSYEELLAWVRSTYS